MSFFFLKGTVSERSLFHKHLFLDYTVQSFSGKSSPIQLIIDVLFIKYLSGKKYISSWFQK